MKKIFLFLIILLISIWIGLKIYENPGYAFFSYGHWSIEMPLWLMIISIITMFLFFYWLIRTFKYGAAIPKKYRKFLNRLRHKKAQELTNKGLIEVAEGYWEQAEKNLLRAVIDKDTALINYLAAAKSAQEQENYQKRDEYLRRAHEINPEAKIAVGLTQAELQLNHKQLEQALATLKHLHELVPKHRYVLKLLTQVYKQLDDWRDLQKLIPILRKYKVFPKDDLNQLELLTTEKLLILSKKAKDDIDNIWQILPRYLRIEPRLVLIYADYLINNEQYQTAEKLIRTTLKKQWSSDLIKLYGNLKQLDLNYLINTAKSWLKYHSNDSNLLLTLGKLCFRNQLWGKAKVYLEESIKFKPQLETYLALGQLCENQRETIEALEYYKKGAFLLQSTLT